MNQLEVYLSNAVNLIWSTPTVVILTLVSVILAIKSKFFVYKNIIIKKNIKNKFKDGDITSLGALSNALAATIGMGNIAGVAIAISQGGAGSLFWMWVAALVGMNLRYFETLAVLKYRVVKAGKINGGAMVALTQVSKSKICKYLAIMFAACGSIGTLSLFQANQLSSFWQSEYRINPILIASILGSIIWFIINGGIKRITWLTTRLVPLMCMVYIIITSIIIFKNFNNIPNVLSEIFSQAFGLSAIKGGVVGAGISHIISTGFKRATFSNEAGLGTAPLAHIDSNNLNLTDEAIRASWGPFIDTIVICTMTGLSILLSSVETEAQGINMIRDIYHYELGSIANYILTVVVTLFAFTTIVGMANYNIKCFQFLFGNSDAGLKIHNCYYSISVMVGCLFGPVLVIHLMDLTYALMFIPNLVLIYLAEKARSNE
jgi:AGCS family alanine or glycine:cation symporter